MNYKQYITTGVATIGLIIPMSVGASTQKGFSKSHQTTKISTFSPREICEDQAKWIFNELIPEIRLKIHTALMRPNSIRVSMIPDPFAVESSDYIKITTIDGTEATQEPINLNLPNPVTQFGVEIGESSQYRLSVSCEK